MELTVLDRPVLALPETAPGQAARSLSGDPGHMPAEGVVSLPEVAVETLGGFRVFRRGVAVDIRQWQSRKARTVLKMLVTRRGAPTQRDVLIDVLWPSDVSERSSNRLSQTLSTVRSVLDPDHSYRPDFYVVSDPLMIRLDLGHVDVDIEQFLGTARDALRLHRKGDPLAPDALGRADDLYRGDFLPEDLYQDWAVAMREQAAAAFVAVERALAERAVIEGNRHVAAACYRRILEKDAYDEEAHLGLIDCLSAGGQHGEAGHCYRRYCQQMKDIGIPPARRPGQGHG
jgi:DNA-binding SARP family transcriptional activator